MTSRLRPRGERRAAPALAYSGPWAGHCDLSSSWTRRWNSGCRAGARRSGSRIAPDSVDSPAMLPHSSESGFKRWKGPASPSRLKAVPPPACRSLELLLPSQVALGRLDAGVPQQKLDLLEGAAGEPAEFRHNSGGRGARVVDGGLLLLVDLLQERGDGVGERPPLRLSTLSSLLCSATRTLWGSP
jgi:hypothetical protein